MRIETDTLAFMRCEQVWGVKCGIGYEVCCTMWTRCHNMVFYTSLSLTNFNLFLHTFQDRVQQHWEGALGFDGHKWDGQVSRHSSHPAPKSHLHHIPTSPTSPPPSMWIPLPFHGRFIVMYICTAKAGPPPTLPRSPPLSGMNSARGGWSSACHASTVKTPSAWSSTPWGGLSSPGERTTRSSYGTSTVGEPSAVPEPPPYRLRCRTTRCTSVTRRQYTVRVWTIVCMKTVCRWFIRSL